LDQLFVATCFVAKKEDAHWRASLPHFYAHAAEDMADSPDRRQILFVYAVICCVNANSMSAIQGVLGGPNGIVYIGFLKEMRQRFIFDRNSPAWLLSRMRAFFAATNVSAD
jgi:hypothetical protein